MEVEAEGPLSSFKVENVEGLESGERTGSGCYGAVYKVTVNGIPRIAKRLLNILMTPDIHPDERQGIKNRFYNECLLLSKLDHPNIVRFIGVQLNPDLSLIMESLHMDLEKFLKVQREIPLPIKLSILLDVSSGLLYLHTQLEEPLIHRDLTPSNILLTKDLRAKIADLGVSKLVHNYPQREHVHTKCPGTLAYMPPEVLCEHPVCDTSLDIFSFGELALYVANQQFPEVYNVTVNPDNREALHLALQNGEVELLRRKKWIDILQQDHCLLDVIQQCLQDEPKKRPASKNLNKAMNTLCVIQPKSLEDFISVWGGEVRVSSKCVCEHFVVMYMILLIKLTLHSPSLPF